MHQTKSPSSSARQCPGTDVASPLADVENFYGAGKAWTLWDDKEGWAIRARTEGDFYPKLLREFGAQRVIDVAAASGFHAMCLAKAGFKVVACDGFRGFIEAGRANAMAEHLDIPFLEAQWQNLAVLQPRFGSFDAALCLGSSIHHVDATGVAELFRNIRTILKPGGIFILEQRNYERLFAERPEVISHPCGWRYRLEYPDTRTLVFHLKDEKRNLNTSISTTITLEDELLRIAEQAGYRLSGCRYDYGMHTTRAESWWIQYVFSV